MSKFTDRIKNVFTVDYDDYDEDYYDDYETVLKVEIPIRLVLTDRLR